MNNRRFEEITDEVVDVECMIVRPESVVHSGILAAVGADDMVGGADDMVGGADGGDSSGGGDEEDEEEDEGHGSALLSQRLQYHLKDNKSK